MKNLSPLASSLLAPLLIATLFGVVQTANAHGNEDHAKKAAPIAKEQKEWGIAGDAKAARRTIAIKMGDNMRFSPDKIQVALGETVRFEIKNDGKIMHEMVIGTKKDLDAHAAMMVKNPGMEHDEPYMTHVAPGKTGTIVWTFNRAGEFDFACLIAGHYQAGMVGKISVGMKKAAAAASGFSLMGTANAQTQNNAPVAAKDMTQAEVKKIDKATGKITLKHEDIKNLDMPGMTMVFQVTDKALLDKVQVGDQIKFKADKQQGKFVVTDIEK